MRACELEGNLVVPIHVADLAGFQLDAFTRSNCWDANVDDEAALQGVSRLGRHVPQQQPAFLRLYARVTGSPRISEHDGHTIVSLAARQRNEEWPAARTGSPANRRGWRQVETESFAALSRAKGRSCQCLVAAVGRSGACQLPMRGLCAECGQPKRNDPDADPSARDRLPGANHGFAPRRADFPCRASLSTSAPASRNPPTPYV